MRPPPPQIIVTRDASMSPRSGGSGATASSEHLSPFELLDRFDADQQALQRLVTNAMGMPVAQLRQIGDALNAASGPLGRSAFFEKAYQTSRDGDLAREQDCLEKIEQLIAMQEPGVDLALTRGLIDELPSIATSLRTGMAENVRGHLAGMQTHLVSLAGRPGVEALQVEVRLARTQLAEAIGSLPLSAKAVQLQSSMFDAALSDATQASDFRQDAFDTLIALLPNSPRIGVSRSTQMLSRIVHGLAAEDLVQQKELKALVLGSARPTEETGASIKAKMFKPAPDKKISLAAEVERAEATLAGLRALDRSSPSFEQDARSAAKQAVAEAVAIKEGEPDWMPAAWGLLAAELDPQVRAVLYRELSLAAETADARSIKFITRQIMYLIADLPPALGSGATQHLAKLIGHVPASDRANVFKQMAISLAWHDRRLPPDTQLPVEPWRAVINEIETIDNLAERKLAHEQTSNHLKKAGGWRWKVLEPDFARQLRLINAVSADVGDSSR